MIYLDAAATTLQKPPQVAKAVAYAIDHMATPGRGGHQVAMLAAEVAFDCREEVAELFHLEQPDQVAFTSNATHSLNLAIRSLVQPGDTVLISGYEHNAVTRTLCAMPGVRMKVATGHLFDSDSFLEEFEDLLTAEVKAVVCTHVSNVFGYVLPVEEVGRLCRHHGVPWILDASQSAGCLPVQMDRLGADFIAMPGHKGLYGPQGTGLLLCGTELVTPLLTGGTGSESLRQDMPDILPDRLEAGTHNIPGIAGLKEGIRYVQTRGVAQIHNHEQSLMATLIPRLQQLPQINLFCGEALAQQTAVLSFQAEDWDCETLAEQLAQRGFALRAGLHCAPLAHHSAGTLDRGTLRLSLSDFNRQEEIEQFIQVLEELLQVRPMTTGV